ncbi:MAG: SIS domain-containing protein [Patescibacteria group bacterium]
MGSAEIINAAFTRNSAVLKKSIEIILPDVRKAAEILLNVAQSDRIMFACGNGGSAADASHLVGEWLCRYKSDRKPLRAISLASELAAVTAIANDYSYEDVFARQLQALGSTGDVLVAITTSGKSRNVIQAIDAAKKKNMKIIVLTGAGGAHLRNSADVVVAVPTTETARIQEIHEIVFHSWCEYVDQNLNLKT